MFKVESGELIRDKIGELLPGRNFSTFTESDQHICITTERDVITISVSGGRGHVSEKDMLFPELEIAVKSSKMEDILGGSDDLVHAYLSGEIEVSGDLSLLVSLSSVFL